MIKNNARANTLALFFLWSRIYLFWTIYNEVIFRKEIFMIIILNFIKEIHTYIDLKSNKNKKIQS